MFQQNFRFWFYSNFYHERTQTNLDNKRIFLPDILDNISSFLSGEAFMKYLDYLELNEARQSALDARKIAKKAHCVCSNSDFINIVINLSANWTHNLHEVKNL